VIDLRESAKGVLLPVHAKPGSSRDAILGEHDQRLKVAVCAVAEKGKANAAIVKLLSKAFRLSKSNFTLSSGETSPRKVFTVTGISIDELRQRLDELTS